MSDLYGEKPSGPSKRSSTPEKSKTKTPPLSRVQQTTPPKLAAAPAAEHKTIPKSPLMTPPPRAKKTSSKSTPRKKSSVTAAAAASPRKTVTPTKAPSARLASSQPDISTILSSSRRSSSSSFASSPSKAELVPPQDTLFDILRALVHNTPNHGAYGLQNAKLKGELVVLKDEKTQKEIFRSYPTLKGIDREQLITLARQLQSFEQTEVTSSSGKYIGPGVGSAKAKYYLLREDCADYLAKNLHIEKDSDQHEQIMKTLEFICHSYRHASVRHPDTLKPGQDTELMPRRNLFFRALTNPADLSRIPDWTLSYTPRKAADRSATPLKRATPTRTHKPVSAVHAEAADRPSPPATPLKRATPTSKAPQPVPAVPAETAPPASSATQLRATHEQVKVLSPSVLKKIAASTSSAVHAKKRSSATQSEPIHRKTADRPSPPATPMRSATPTSKAPQPVPAVPIPAALPPSPSESPELMVEQPPMVETPPLRSTAIEVPPPPPVIIEPRVPPPMVFKYTDPWDPVRVEQAKFRELIEELKILATRTGITDRDFILDWQIKTETVENQYRGQPKPVKAGYEEINAALTIKIDGIKRELGIQLPNRWGPAPV